MRVTFAYVLTALAACYGFQLSSPAHADGRASSISSTLPVRSMIGVAVRRPTESDLEAIKDAGIDIVRADLSWSATERSRGSYDFSAYLPAAKAMQRLKIRPIYVLAYGNPLYDPLVPTLRYRYAASRPAAPTSATSVAAFSRWAMAAARIFAPTSPIFEIWNEPDIDHWWPPHANARQYGVLANAVCTKLHAFDPSLIVIGPGVAQPVTAAGRESPFLKDLAQGSALGCLDAISTHNYALSGDTRMDKVYLSTTKHMLDGALLRNKPIWSSEWGWTAVNGDLNYQASYLVKTFMIAVANGVSLNIWYQWKDWHTDVDASLNHYGLISSTGAPKPAYVALRHLLHAIGDYHFKCATSPSPKAFAVVFTSGSKPPVLVSWGQHPSLGEVWRRTGRVHTGEDLQGRPITADGSNFGADPVYLSISSAEADDICGSDA